MILCFGDSLTAGFQSPTPEHPFGQETPYGHFLQEWIQSAAEIRVRGICGELTREMALRFHGDVVLPQPSHVVLLGGTNDLGWNVQPAEIMKNLIRMYEMACLARIQPIPVTVPSLRVDITGGGPDAEAWLEQHLSRRAELNGLIRAYAVSKSLPWIDLFGATVDSATGQLAEPFSNDGLHLSTAGYRLFAQLLYDQVFAGVFPFTK